MCEYSCKWYHNESLQPGKTYVHIRFHSFSHWHNLANWRNVDQIRCFCGGTRGKCGILFSISKRPLTSHWLLDWRAFTRAPYSHAWPLGQQLGPGGAIRVRVRTRYRHGLMLHQLKYSDFFITPAGRDFVGTWARPSYSLVFCIFCLYATCCYGV